MRFVRAGLLEVLGSDYVRTARAKGVREHAVVLRHALRNALIPVVTVIGIQLALLLSGAVVVETVFSIRGLGRILVGAIFDRDYPIVQGVILLIAVIFVLANLIVDIVYTFLDPADPLQLGGASGPVTPGRTPKLRCHSEFARNLVLSEQRFPERRVSSFVGMTRG